MFEPVSERISPVQRSRKSRWRSGRDVDRERAQAAPDPAAHAAAGLNGTPLTYIPTISLDFRTEAPVTLPPVGSVRSQSTCSGDECACLPQTSTREETTMARSDSATRPPTSRPRPPRAPSTSRVPRRQLGCALLAPGRLHPRVHHRARRVREAQGRVRPAQREAHRPERRPARVAQEVGAGHRRRQGHPAQLPARSRTRTARSPSSTT